MARSLEPELTITDWDKPGPCELCGSPKRDPDNMDRWAEHLTTLHGYRVVEDRPRPVDGSQPRTIYLQLVGWSEKAKFQHNQRVNVKAESRPRDYAGRRGTVVGWNAPTSAYAVTFDEPPIYGWLSSRTLEAYTPSR